MVHVALDHRGGADAALAALAVEQRVAAMLDQAVAALKAGQWPQAAARMRPLANVLLPHTATDQVPLRKHPLEFVLHQFRPEFYEQSRVAEVEQVPAISVRFAAGDEWQVAADLLEPLGEVQDIALADFDVDGRVDVILLGSQAVGVFARTAAAPQWKQIATSKRREPRRTRSA